ncbi:bifunctional DNA primase/polymerase [Actinosynnema sp. CA-299493]
MLEDHQQIIGKVRPFPSDPQISSIARRSSVAPLSPSPPMQCDDLFEVVPASAPTTDPQQKGKAVPTSTPDTEPSTTLQAALSYAELGWPVLPGAIWHDGHFASPVDELPVTSPCLRPIAEATTDANVVRAWWSTPGLHAANVFTVTGPELGAFAVGESLVMALADDPWFAAFPTPVLSFPNMPIAYFLVRPPLPSVLLSHEARVMEAGMPMPLPPSALETTPVIWLVTPEQAGNVLWPGDALADLIQTYEKRKSA